MVIDMPTAEQIEQSRRESFEAIDRADGLLADQARDDVKPEETSGFSEPRTEHVESRNDRHRREITERDEAWARERRAEQRDIAGVIDQRIAAALAETDIPALIERLTVTEQHLFDIARGANAVARGVTDEMLELRTTLAKVETEHAKLETRVIKLQNELAERGIAIDLPPLPLRSVQ